MTARTFFRSLVILLASALVALTMVPAALAQYTIPDCLVAAINGMLPDEGFAAARDQNYRKDSAQWDAETAGLTPEQLQGYRGYFCASFSVVDQGADSDGGHNLVVNWPTVDGYLQSIGQRRGVNGGGSSGNTGSSNTGSGNTGSGSTGSGKTGSVGTGNVQPVDAADANAADVLFSTDFDALPPELELRDENDDVIDGTLTTEAGESILQIESDATRALYVTGANDWTDYAVEARVKITNGSLLLSTRTAGNYCSSYDFYIEPATHYGSVQTSDADCKSTLLQDRSDLAIKPDKWTTIRLESTGSQISASVDGKIVLTAGDDSYTQGFPALILFPDDDKTATLDVDSLQIIAVHPPPETLADFAGTPAQVVAELQSLGQLPTGKGTLIFQQKSAFAAGSGLHYYLMAVNSPRTDIVMAATIKFKPAGSDQVELCQLLARTTTGGEIVGFGFDSDGYLNFDENTNGDNGQRYLNSPDASYPPGESYHLLVTLIGSQAVIYVDGARALEVDDIDVHAGTYALVLVGANGNSRCDASNYWAYSFK